MSNNEDQEIRPATDDSPAGGAGAAVVGEINSEMANCRSLEQRLAKSESKAAAKHEELVTTIRDIHKKWENCERSKESLKKVLGKLSRQKLELERKLLSLQGPETRLVCHNTDWTIDANLWAATHDFMKASAPMLTLCAGETIDSLTFQLQVEHKNHERAKELLVQYQDQITNLISSINKSCSCQTGSDKVESNEVGKPITTMNQRIQSLQEILPEKDFELDQLKKKKSVANDDKNKLGALKSLVLYYQSKYTAERKSRKTITLERDELMAKLQLLMDKNKRLAAQVNSQGESINPGLSRLTMEDREPLTPEPHLSITATPTGGIKTSAEPILACINPDCKRKFETLEPLQYHVLECLQLFD